MSDDVRADLEQLAERRRQVANEQRALSGELRDAIDRAVAESMPLNEIADVLGISRQALWKLRRGD